MLRLVYLSSTSRSFFILFCVFFMDTFYVLLVVKVPYEIEK